MKRVSIRKLFSCYLAAAMAMTVVGCASAEQQALTTVSQEEAMQGSGSRDVSSEASGSSEANTQIGSQESTVEDDSIYTNATYGFTFDPRFCEDLVLIDEAVDAAVFESESWGMRVYVQGSENTNSYDAQGLVDAISAQAFVADGDPVVGENYCLVQQLERVDDQDRVVTYMFFIGNGNYQGLIGEFDPAIYESLTSEQGSQLVAAFLPGDLTATHEELIPVQDKS